MKMKFNKNIVKKILDDVVVLYDTDSGAFYCIGGSLKKFFYENDSFDIKEAIIYLIKNYKIDELVAQKDVHDILKDLVDNGLLEVENIYLYFMYFFNQII